MSEEEMSAQAHSQQESCPNNTGIQENPVTDPHEEVSDCVILSSADVVNKEDGHIVSADASWHYPDVSSAGEAPSATLPLPEMSVTPEHNSSELFDTSQPTNPSEPAPLHQPESGDLTHSIPTGINHSTPWTQTEPLQFAEGPDFSHQTETPQEMRERREDSIVKRAQTYFEFKERIGRLSTSCGDSYAGEVVAFCSREFSESTENYLRGCKWSPDGNVLLTNSNDNQMRVFQIPEAVINNQCDVKTELRSSLKVAETDTVFDFCWYPAMSSDSPETSLFATTCRETPIHLLSAVTGELVATYRPYNHVDEIVAAHSIGFTCDGKHLVSGFNRTLRCFDTNRPGRECVVISTIVKEKNRKGKTVSVQGQRSILSCFAAHPTDPSVMAAGAFNGDVAIYDIPSGTMTMMFEGQSGGITHVTFSKDGNYLFAGGRKNPEINCFDIRNPEKVLYVLYRYVATNQRIYFDLDRSSRYLVSGNHNGKVSVWDLQGQAHLHDGPFTPWPQLDPVINFQAHQDAVNGCSVNPKHSLLATCSGQRHFSIDILDEIVDMELDTAISTNSEIEENTLKLWNLKLPG
ncbi:telomerase Cajal body protein 1-like [Littorina saxatilis]|uniref:WD repeat-containing protein 79 n=1 Tax=Littorina saxatilis TaxID=31220 RepID=A0AAN9G1J6_9CAEN